MLLKDFLLETLLLIIIVTNIILMYSLYELEILLSLIWFIPILIVVPILLFLYIIRIIIVNLKIIMHLGSLIKIYDIEILINCFIYMDIDSISDEINIFVIHYSRNDIDKLVPYLKQLKGQIGFNCLSFDSQICQFIIINYESDKWQNSSIDEILDDIFKFSQETINKQDVGFPTYNERNLYCKQCDLLKIHHFDNQAKRQSLKGLQCNLNWHKVQEMPIDFNSSIDEKQLEEVIDYCKNDILSTKHFYKDKSSKDAIELRKGLAKSYNLDHTIMNWSDSRIGSELILKFYCEHTKKDPKVVRKLRTNRESIDLKDCIPKNIKFQTKEFNTLLEKFRNTTLYQSNDWKFGSNGEKEEIIVHYKGLDYYYGSGGLHASLVGNFEPNEDQVIYDIDVSSLYPSIGIVNNYYPLHLGEEFVSVYRDKIVNVRLEEKRKGDKGDKAIILGLKNAANSVYGKSNDRYSFLYDPNFTFSITATGQMNLSMLVEQICENIDCKVIQANTDGLSILLNKKNIIKFQEICAIWEKQTKLELEGYCNRGDQKEVLYRRMYIRDCNNYIAVTTKGKIKFKGCFEKDKLLHKDPSARIVPLALEQYVVNGIKPEETINKHSNMWDFLIRTKFKKGFRGEYRGFKNGKLIKIPAEKVARYFISNTGYTFVKLKYEKDTDGNERIISKSLLRKGFQSLDLNKINSENAFDYDINRQHYILEAYKIIDLIEPKNTSIGLFNEFSN